MGRAILGSSRKADCAKSWSQLAGVDSNLWTSWVEQVLGASHAKRLSRDRSVPFVVARFDTRWDLNPRPPGHEKPRDGFGDDVELLGKLVTRRSWWAIPGLTLHLGNGTAFGAVYALVCPKLPGPAWVRGLVVAQAENFGLWPLASLTDRHHPAREELTHLTGNRRALAQATWRHALFGLVLGVVETRLQRRWGLAGCVSD
jgi:hypothetical protein